MRSADLDLRSLGERDLIDDRRSVDDLGDVELLDLIVVPPGLGRIERVDPLALAEGECEALHVALCCGLGRAGGVGTRRDDQGHGPHGRSGNRHLSDGRAS